MTTIRIAARCGLAMVTSLALASCGGGSSGGGGGGGGGPQPPPPIPQSVAWQFDSPTGDFSALVDFGTDGGGTQVSLPIVNFAGTWNTVTDDLVIRTGPSPAETMRVDAPGLFAVPLDLVITTELGIPPGAEHPATGVFEARFGTSVVVCTCAPTEVTLVLDGGVQSATLSWDAFDSIEPGGTEPEYQQAASFAYGASRFVLEQFERALQGLDAVRTDEQDLRTAGSGNPIVENGDSYPPTGVVGSLAFSWIDNGDPGGQGEVGAGDDFVAVFTDYWVNEPDPNESEELLDGTIRLIDYIESANPFALGFQTITFQTFVIVETEEVSPGTWVEDSRVEVNGSLRMQLTPASS